MRSTGSICCAGQSTRGSFDPLQHSSSTELQEFQVRRDPRRSLTQPPAHSKLSMEFGLGCSGISPVSSQTLPGTGIPPAPLLRCTACSPPQCLYFLTSHQILFQPISLSSPPLSTAQPSPQPLLPPAPPTPWQPSAKPTPTLIPQPLSPSQGQGFAFVHVKAPHLPENFHSPSLARSALPHGRMNPAGCHVLTLLRSIPAHPPGHTLHTLNLLNRGALGTDLSRISVT